MQFFPKLKLFNPNNLTCVSSSLFKISETHHIKWINPCGLEEGQISYLGDGVGGHFDTLLKQHAQYAVLLLQVEHAGPQLHTFLL